MNSFLEISALVSIVLSVEDLMVAWFGRVNGVTLPSAFSLLSPRWFDSRTRRNPKMCKALMTLGRGKSDRGKSLKNRVIVWVRGSPSKNLGSRFPIFNYVTTKRLDMGSDSRPDVFQGFLIGVSLADNYAPYSYRVSNEPVGMFFYDYPNFSHLGSPVGRVGRSRS